MWLRAIYSLEQFLLNDSKVTVLPLILFKFLMTGSAGKMYHPKR